MWSLTVRAPVVNVWPWLVQMGQGRGGFYSYDWLENLIGCDIHNANQILPDFQSLRVGDAVRLHPKAPPLPVAIVEPYRALVLGGRDVEQQEQDPARITGGTWGFYLREVDANTTRLLIRSRWNWKARLLPWMGYYLLLEPSHFIMERRMMLGIKQRAERSATTAPERE
jgi:hypothetical protein